MPPTAPSFARILLHGSDVSELRLLRNGSETAFRSLVARHGDTLLRVARTVVGDATLAEEVVQQTWVEVLESSDRFESRSTVRTWLCGICINTARSRMRKERRSVPLSSLAKGESPDERAVDPALFFSDDSAWAGHWKAFPTAWPETPEDSAYAGEVRARLLAAVDALPEAQREVLVLRDVEGFSGEETCNVLGLSDTHQRVLLHRARSRLRNVLADVFDGTRLP